MSLQFLTNINPPPAQSALEYDIEPGTVFVSTGTQTLYADLTITVSNTTNTTVNCMEFQFGFLAGAPAGNLTTASAAGNVTPVADQNEWNLVNAGFSGSNPNLCLFTATPSGIQNYLPLAPNASFTFHLNNILIDRSVGEGAAPFTIIEQTIGSNRSKQTVQGILSVTKTIGQLAITAFNVSPATAITPGTPIELSWTVTGTTGYQLWDADAAQKLYDSNDPTQPPDLTQWPVAPQQLTPPQTTQYRLIASAGQLHTSQDTTAMVEAARFKAQPTAEPPATGGAGQQSILKWQTQWAEKLTISANGFGTVTFNAPAGEFDIFPSAPGNQYAVFPPGTTTYTLEIFGPNNSSDTRQVTVSVKGPTPIVSLTATPEVSSVGQPVRLTWTTSYAQNGVSLLVRAPGQPDPPAVTGLPEQKSDYPPPVQPLEFTSYVMTAIGVGDQTTVSVPVVKTAGQLNGAEVLAALAAVLQKNVPGIDWKTFLSAAAAAPFQPAAYDGANIWFQFKVSSAEPDITAWLVASLPVNQIAQPQLTFYILSISEDVGFAPSAELGAGVLTTDSFCVLYGQQIVSWSLLTPPAISVARLWPLSATTPSQTIASDGRFFWLGNATSIVRWNIFTGSQYGNAIAVGCIPNGLINDGTNMWACQESGTITKIRINDGAVLGSLKVGTNLTAIFFDGNYIWVAEQPSRTVIKIQPNNLTIVGQPINVDQVVGQFAFDGQTLWMTNDQPVNPVAQVSGMRVSDNTLLGGVPVSYAPGLVISILFDGTYLWVGDAQAIAQWIVKTS